MISKLFADDYKAYNAVDYKLYPMLMQKSLDSLCSWSDTWQLDLALSKCGSLMLACGTKYVDENDLIVGDHVLSTFDTIIDLGVTIDCDLRFAKHIKNMVSKARQRIFLIFKSFLVRDVDILTIAFKSYIRPILEYGSVVWSPTKLCDIDCIEDVQRNFTKRLQGLSDLPYADRLVLCGLQSLELRRLNIDLILVFKIVYKLVSLDFDRFFALDKNNRTRGHNIKLSLPRCSSRVRQNFFSIRVITAWNSLPSECVNSTTVRIFKTRLLSVDLRLYLSRSMYDYV